MYIYSRVRELIEKGEIDKALEVAKSRLGI
jgi:hypothetical protein